jgi:hypothetical protein
MSLTLLGIYACHFVGTTLVLRPGMDKYAIYLKLVGPLGTFVLNFFKDGANHGEIYGFLAMINYDLVFMSQGIVDSVFYKELEKSYNLFSNTSA